MGIYRVKSENSTLTPKRVDGAAGPASSIVFDNTGTDISATDVEGAIKELDSNYILLWTNSSPNSNFSNQTISLDLSRYKGILVYSASTISGSESEITSSVIILKGLTCRILTGNGYAYRRRSCTVSDNGVTFGHGYQASYNTDITTEIETDSTSIPLMIYGIK